MFGGVTSASENQFKISSSVTPQMSIKPNHLETSMNATRFGAGPSAIPVGRSSRLVMSAASKDSNPLTEGKPTLTYFQAYARGEGIRMALWKAGIEFENEQLNREEWQMVKADTMRFPNGQLPVLRLSDGTVLTQTMSIMNYIADIGGLKSDDPLVNAKADALAQYTNADVLTRFGKILFSQDEDRDD